jgi:hypothetical protein
MGQAPEWGYEQKVSNKGFSGVSFDYEQQEPEAQQEEQLERQQVDSHLQDLLLLFTAQQNYISFGEECDELDTEVESDIVRLRSVR